MQVNREKTTVKKKITYFLKNYVASKKSLQFANLFYRFVFRCEVLYTFCILFVWNSIHNIGIFRSSHPEVFLGKGVLKICSKFTGEHPCRSVISIKFLCKFTEITLQQGRSPVNLLHIFRTPFPKNTAGRLLLCLLLHREKMC